ncbi:MAG TPA: amidohydrolase family protein, partial [Ferruginibacter sp.]|nr:amidohydrolase family protein [Ferruginibacter sp.]
MKYFLLYSFSLIVLNTTAQVADVLITNGRIIDGTGNSWFYGDIAIKDGKIIKVGNASNYTAAKTIDAKQLIIAPGFIDVHTHIEGEEFRNPTANNFILDGVTTVVTGNCGASNVDIKYYLWQIDSLKPSINVATLIGHNDVRKAVM